MGGGGIKKIPRKWKILGVGGGGSSVKFPPWWGYGYFLELHIFEVLFKRVVQVLVCYIVGD